MIAVNGDEALRAILLVGVYYWLWACWRFR
jgi:hypothetical protein